MRRKGRVVQHSYSHYFPSSATNYLLILPVPAHHPPNLSYIWTGRDGTAGAELPSFSGWAGVSWCGLLCQFSLATPGALIWVGLRELLWMVDSGGFNWRPGMRSHIRTINFGYYYSSKGKVGRSNANKWFYERILFAIIWSMVFLRLRINTGRGARGRRRRPLVLFQ